MKLKFMGKPMVTAFNNECLLLVNYLLLWLSKKQQKFSPLNVLPYMVSCESLMLIFCL